MANYSTPHYGLTAFSTQGAPYSATQDRKRFTILDNALDFISADLIGTDGIIDGWSLGTVGQSILTIQPGLGIISEFATRTYGTISVALPNNQISYVFMKRKGLIGGQGALSKIVHLTYTNSNPPSTPSTPQLVSATSNSVSMSWDSNPEIDILRYDLYRNSTFIASVSPCQTLCSYTDTAVQPNITYTYKTKAVNVNQLQSGFSSILTASTTIDYSIPSSPSNVQVVASDSRLELLWDLSTSSVDHYSISLQQIDTENNSVGSPTVFSPISPTISYLIIPDLVNSNHYSLSITAVSAFNISSSPIIVFGTPELNSGPQDISNIIISDFALNSSWQIGLNITWDLPSEYINISYFFVTISGPGETGSSSIYLSNSVQITKYTLADGSIKSLQENTQYIILIQSSDSQGNVSVGTIIRYITNKFSVPNPITDLTITTTFTLSEQSLTTTWNNSNTEFAYNLITVYRTSLNTPPDFSPSNIVDNQNIGTANSFTVSGAEVVNNASYLISVVAVDQFSNSSQPLSLTSVIAQSPDLPSTAGGVLTIGGLGRPGVPDQQEAIGLNGKALIRWNKYPGDFVTNYCIYKATANASLSPTDFTKIATVPNNVFELADYAVTNGIRYVYFVTVISNSLESLNPSDGFISYLLSTCSPHSTTNIPSGPTTVNISQLGHDAILNWVNSSGGFDGYEILKSIGNNYSFNIVGSVSPSVNTFIDENGLLLSGDYYYTLIPYRNEATVFVTNELIVPLNALFLGQVTVSDGIITAIDSSQAVIIKNLLTPVTNLTKAELQLPLQYYSAADDRRIRLGNNFVVDNFVTNDYISYSTPTNILQTGDFVVLLNGAQTALSYSLDKDNGVLTFGAVTLPPSNLPPTVSIVFINQNETTGTLPQSNISSIPPIIITKGIFEPDRFNIDHKGRNLEQLISSQTALAYIDGYSYVCPNTLSTTFYDALSTVDGEMLVATSSGILLSGNNEYQAGIWNTVFSGPGVATKLFYSQQYNIYLAAVQNLVYSSSDAMTWTPSSLPGVNIVKDFTEDESGNIFASTDAGIQVLNLHKIKTPTWIQSSLIDPEQIETFSILWVSGTLYVSGENGLYASTDAGLTWTATGTAIAVPVYSLINYGGIFYACTTSEVWRADNSGQYYIIAPFQDYCRKLVGFNNALYLMTNLALLKSVDSANIASDQTVPFEIALSNLNRNGILPPVTCLYSSSLSDYGDGQLYVGSDNRLYSVTTSGNVLLRADFPIPCPTIFVSGITRNISVYYSNEGQLFFNEQTLPTDQITIVTAYQNLYTPVGGWIRQNYLAPIYLYVDGILTAAGQPSGLAQDIIPAITTLNLTSFNARNSNYEAALAALNSIVQIANAISNLTATTPIPASVLSGLFLLIDQFEANIDPSLQQNVCLQPIGGTILTVSPGATQNNVTISSLSNSIGTFDTVRGTVSITGITIDKYDLMQLTIAGGVLITNTGQLSHDELDNAFDSVNSGLPTSFSFVQQSAVNKLGLGPLSITDGVQVSYGQPCSQWYGSDSTVDYKLVVDQEGSALDIYYPADVLYVEQLQEMWICGQNGILAINANFNEYGPNSCAVRKVFAHNFYVYNMCLNGSTVNALAQDGLYVIDLNTGDVTKNVDITLPPGYSSVFFLNPVTLITTPTGLYGQQPYDEVWTQLINIENPVIRGTNSFYFVIGEDVSGNSLVYFSTGGGNNWGPSGTYTGTTITSVARRLDLVYLASDTGLFVNDLGHIFANDGTTSQIVDLVNDPTLSEQLIINDVAADNSRVIAGDSSGKFYVIESGNITVKDSGLGAIHKVRIANGTYWLFGYNTGRVEGFDPVISLSSGKRIT